MPNVTINGPFGLPTQRQLLAINGSYWTVTNPTPGTAIVGGLLTSFSETANGFMLVRNTAQAGGKVIVFDRMKMTQTATAPTGTLQMHFETKLETAQVIATGNVSAANTRVPVNSRPGMSPTPSSVASVQTFAAGQMTIPAASGTRSQVDLGFLATGVTVANDEYVVEFGTDASASTKVGLTAARATDPARHVTQMAPLVIDPQCTGWINMWWVTAGANTPSFEFSLSWIEIQP